LPGELKSIHYSSNLPTTMDTNIKTRVIGIDIGVKKTTISVVDIRGMIIATDYMQTTDYPMLNNFIEELSLRIVSIAEANGGYEVIRSVGISAPSSNFLTGSIENAVNIPWKGVIPLAALLRDRIGLAVAVGNDAHITALGERAFGSAHGLENFIVVTIGHGGVGSCIFINGQAHLGSGGYAGEFGHCCIEDGGRLCNCGRRGCLEEYVTDRGIIHTARDILESSDAPSLMRDLKELTPSAISECCEKGDALALETYNRTGFYFGIALANYATIVNPQAIILTGELGEDYKWYLDAAEQSFNEHVFGNIRGKVKLMVSLLNSQERDVLGASALAWTVEEYSLFK